MKNNTKLIMETWRRFLKEGPDGIDKPLPDEAEFESDDPPEDADLSGNPFDREVQGGGPGGEYIPDEGIIDDLLGVLEINPSASDEELMEKVPEAYREDIDAARKQLGVDYEEDDEVEPLSGYEMNPYDDGGSAWAEDDYDKSYNPESDY